MTSSHHLIVTPAYGRDYKKREEIEADILAGRDFLLQAFDGPCRSCYINLEQMPEQGRLHVRFRKATSFVVFRLEELKAK